MKQKKKARRPKDRSATENLLIEAATRVFAQYGFAASTTRLIAQEAGVNLALITRYFGNKQGLLLSVLETIAATSSDNSIPYSPKETLMDECLAYSEYHLSRMLEGIEFIRIIVVQSITDSDFAKNLRELEFLETEEIHARVRKFLKGKADPALDEKARLLVEFLDRAIFGTAVTKFLIEGKSKDVCQKELKESLQVFFTVLN